MKIEVETDVLKPVLNQIKDSLEIMRALKNKEVRVCDIEKLAGEGTRKLTKARYRIYKLLGKDASI
jgi:hypothetical protein